ncbi:hypothetical protein EDB83DRAFT_2425589 [Lactarius deliciosus]|nr:hypothetical protein EDB83DRAFT_2425589 [Lactarius deliciosus]
MGQRDNHWHPASSRRPNRCNSAFWSQWHHSAVPRDTITYPVWVTFTSTITHDSQFLPPGASPRAVASVSFRYESGVQGVACCWLGAQTEPLRLTTSAGTDMLAYDTTLRPNQHTPPTRSGGTFNRCLVPLVFVRAIHNRATGSRLTVDLSSVFWWSYARFPVRTPTAVNMHQFRLWLMPSIPIRPSSDTSIATALQLVYVAHTGKHRARHIRGR